MRTGRGTSTHRAGMARGFSLLEIVVVLALTSLLIAGGMGFMALSGDERYLRESSGEIEILAKRARTMAILQQTPYALVVDVAGVHMMPLAHALQRPAGRVGPEDDSQVVADNLRFPPQFESWFCDENDQLFVRRWASDYWLPADERSKHLWRFDPDGLCEPVSIRINRNNNWIASEYHPLTAGIRQTEMEINN